MRTILLVDDNEGFRYLIKTLFENSNLKKYTFLEAENPIEALEIFYKCGKRIDIVVCDFFLPVQNGNELLEIIKAQNPLTRCLLISADDYVRTKKYKLVDEVFTKSKLSNLIDYVKMVEDNPIA